jgi:hypothetical protein
MPSVKKYILLTIRAVSQFSIQSIPPTYAGVISTNKMMHVS